MKYRKLPVVVEAVLWDGKLDTDPDIRQYPDLTDDCEECNRPNKTHGWINTLESGHRVCPGDYIITGVEGERYPCKPGIFHKTYEPAE